MSSFQEIRRLIRAGMLVSAEGGTFRIWNTSPGGVRFDLVPLDEGEWTSAVYCDGKSIEVGSGRSPEEGFFTGAGHRVEFLSLQLL